MGWQDIVKTVSPVLGVIGDVFGQSSANQTNMRIAQKQMDFQREMSNTAMQRRVEDLRKAGLNEMLAFREGGAGASTPGGAAIPVHSVMSRGVASAVEASQAMLNLANAAKSKKEVDLVTAQELESNTRTDLLVQDRNRIVELTNVLETEGLLNKARADEIRERIKIMGQEQRFNDLSFEHQSELMPVIVELQKANAEAAILGLSELRSWDSFWRSKAGQVYPYQKQIESGMNAVGNMLPKINLWRGSRGGSGESRGSWSPGGSAAGYGARGSGYTNRYGMED